MSYTAQADLKRNYSGVHNFNDAVVTGVIADGVKGELTPEQFFAVGDGVVDDTGAFLLLRAAITDNAVIRLDPTKNYKVVGTPAISVTGKNNITVLGGGSIRQRTGVYALEFFNCNDVDIKDIAVSSPDATGAIGIYADACNGVYIKDSLVFGFKGTAYSNGIKMRNCSNVEVKNNVLYENGNGSGVGDVGDICVNYPGDIGSNIKILDNLCTSDQGRYNIAAFNSSDIKISGNTCTGALANPNGTSGGYGIVVYSNQETSPGLPRDSKVIISGNYCYNLEGSGIYVQQFRDTTIQGNIVENVCQVMTDASLLCAGIVADMGGGSASVATITGNVIKTGLQNGIEGYGGAIAISNNTIESISKRAIYLRLNCHNSVISSNIIKNSFKGIHVANSNDVSISVNNIGNTTGDDSAIRIYGTSLRPKVTNNIINGCASYGLTYFPSSVLNGGEISNNRFINTAYDAVYLRDVTGISVLSNVITGATAFVGISENAAAGSNIIKDNQITGYGTPYQVASTSILVRDSCTFAQLLAPANGSRVYVTNGASGSPVTTGGTGVYANRVNGQWIG